MSFWDLSSVSSDVPALLLGAGSASAASVTYGQLAAQCDALWKQVKQHEQKGLGILLCGNTPQTYFAYLAALRGGDAVILLNENTEPSLLHTIVQAYRPEWMIGSCAANPPEFYRREVLENGMSLLRRQPGDAGSALHPDLAVLLSTSGTTGSPKMVRLSYRNIESNALSIVKYLEIVPGSKAITTLPFNYSYGMSIANSYFSAGASLALTDASFTNRAFWDAFSFHEVNSLAGVPYTFQMLQRLNPRKLPIASLRTLTQAGGALNLRLTDYFCELADEMGWKFFVMYGQTEAAPRISYVPPAMLASKRGSIGIAIPGGKLSISAEGELIYEGPNVMMGYSQTRKELSAGDELQGRLATGDLAIQDEDGYFFLRGRLKRFVKVFGNRISLDDIEQKLEAELGISVAVTGEDDRISIYLDGNDQSAAARSILNTLYHLHASAWHIHVLQALPFTASGKKDYARLQP